ncbi:MOSC N-terminal beta barrel domain-containing protein [Gaiella sp.]|uniref:MOSC domain-containing protein n=1 Tax=Gaiella sp. TaxID=2663207 RepID=UPI0032679B7E
MDSASVSEIAYCPVKGLALTLHDTVDLELTGVRDNRRFHLVGTDGRLANGKRAGALVQIAATCDPDGTALALRFPCGSVIESEVALGAPIVTDFYGRPAGGRLVEGPFAQALSDFVGRDLRLVRLDEPGAGSDRGSEGSVSLVSTATLERLALEAERETIDSRRFRMLFTITGVGEHEEETWLGRTVAIGDAIVRLEDVVGRCAVTTQDPDTGVPDLDTLRILKRYRPTGGAEPLPIGVWGQVEQPGVVRIGDAVRAQ